MIGNAGQLVAYGRDIKWTGIAESKTPPIVDFRMSHFMHLPLTVAF